MSHYVYTVAGHGVYCPNGDVISARLVKHFGWLITENGHRYGAGFYKVMVEAEDQKLLEHLAEPCV